MIIYLFKSMNDELLIIYFFIKKKKNMFQAIN